MKRPFWKILLIPERKNRLWSLLRLPLLAFLLLWGLSACGVTDRAFFYPTKDPQLKPPAFLGDVRDERFDSLDGTRLTRWVVPVIEPAQKPLAVVLQVHGNAAHLGNHIYGVDWLRHEQVEAHAFDYRGFGSSEGRVKNRLGPLQDTRAAIAEAKAYASKHQLPLFILGQSIGGNLAAAAMAEDGSEGVKGLILDCTFSSWQDIAADSVTPALAWLVSDKYSAKDTLKKIPEDLPIFLLHSEADRVVSLEHFERLKALLEDRPHLKTLTVPQVGHIMALSDSPAAQRALLNFIQEPRPQDNPLSNQGTAQSAKTLR